MNVLYTFKHAGFEWALIHSKTKLMGIDCWTDHKPSKVDFIEQVERGSKYGGSNYLTNYIDRDLRPIGPGYIITRQKPIEDNEFGPVVP